MVRVVVAGMAECSRFAHVDYLAEYLAERLPDFDYCRIVQSRYAWPAWIVDVNRKNKWNHVCSPIVWREPGLPGGKAYLIGDASNFWDYVDEYYGVLSNVTKAEGELLAIDVFQKFLDSERTAEQEKKRQRHRRVTISGASHSMTSQLVREMLAIPELQMDLGVVVTLYDLSLPEADDRLVELAMEERGVGALAGLTAVRATESAREAFANCDLLIVLDGYPRDEDEDMSSWLSRNCDLMTFIGMSLNQVALETCKVVYAAPGMPACFNANVLADTVIDIRPENVVAVTADLGLEALHTVIGACEVPVRDMHCPPVWGSIGINKLVDLKATRYRTELVMPNKRALKANPDTTLPTATIKKVTYPMTPILRPVEGLWGAVEKDRAASADDMYLAKVKATCDMLRFWFRTPEREWKRKRLRRQVRLMRTTDETYRDKVAAAIPKGPIISLGVLSTGTFRIPQGLNFSQQVCLRNGRWVPYKWFPQPMDRNVKLKDLYNLPSAHLKYLNVGKCLDADYLLSPEDLKEKKLENFHRDFKRHLEKHEMEKKDRIATKAKERALNIRFRRYWRTLDRESDAMIRDNVVNRTVRDLINIVLDICEPYPDKIEVVYKHANFKIDELGEEEQAEEEEKVEDEEDGEDDDEDGEDDDD